MKKTILIALLLCCTSARSADQALAPVPQITEHEAAETILQKGVIVRIIDGESGDVRVGDGITPGGVRIGYAGRWAEGTPLTQDLYLDGHTINLGQGYTLTMLGGWGALSGPAEVQAGDGKIRISSYGSVLIEGMSESSAVHLDIAYVAPYIELTAQIGEVQPTIEATTNLVTASWDEPVIAGIVTNASTWVFQIDPAQFSAYAFFRATIPSGSASYVNIVGTLKENGEAVALAADVSALEARTNDWNTAYSTATQLVAAVSEIPTNHASLAGLQGGTSGEYYHLTAEQAGALVLTNNITQTVTTNATDIPSGAAVTAADAVLQGQITTNAADIAALETEVDGIGNVVWYTSSDKAFINIGTNTFWIFATASPTDTVFSIGEWTVTTTNATLSIGTNTVEVRP